MSVFTQPGATQLVKWFDAKPWMSRIGSPVPAAGALVDIGEVETFVPEELHRRSLFLRPAGPRPAAWLIARWRALSPSTMPFLAAMPAFSSSTKRTGTPGEITASDNDSPCLIALMVPSCAMKIRSSGIGVFFIQKPTSR